jgi:type I restriction-modification system DNA methylase subunit
MGWLELPWWGRERFDSDGRQSRLTASLGSPAMELYSEQDVMSKVIVPELEALDYKETKQGSNGVVLRFNHPIGARQGRQKKKIFADLVVYVHDAPVIVIDAKNPRGYLTDNDREQVVSYARLLEEIAPYAALCNGPWRIFDSVSKQEINALPGCRDLIRDLQRRRLSSGQKSSLVKQATRTLFAIESVRDLSRLMRRCHDIIRNLKGYDPTKAFDELSKILFAKMYEERELAEGKRDANRFTLDQVRAMRDQGVDIIQVLWQETTTSERFREVFKDDETTAESDIELPPEAIDKIVELLEDKSLGLTDLDVKGVAFEEFLSATYRGGGLGQYFTPREVVHFMVDLVSPQIGDRVIDPSCGSGGFLIQVYDVLSDKILTSGMSKRVKDKRLGELANECLVGIDWETRAARTCKMNMIIHGDGHAGVYHGNALDLEELTEKVEARKKHYPDAPEIADESFDVVLTNPPFGARDDVPKILAPYELGKGRTAKREVLLLERQIRLMRPGGRLAVVVPEGVLSNRNDRHIRDYIRRECVIKAVIRLPQDAFRLSEGAACTSILYAVKKDPEDPELPEQGDIFFARAEHIGSSPSGKPIAENDLLAIREQFRRFESGEWDGIEMEHLGGDRVEFIREEPDDEEEDLWLEPVANRTSLLYDRLSYVLRAPRVEDRFGYTYNHPRYYRTVQALEEMEVPVATLESLCVEPYPARGKKPSEESADGIPILKVRNVTGNGINLDTEFAPDTEETRSTCGRSLVLNNDLLITSTGEGTIGKVDVWPYGDEGVADSHISICRLKPEVNLRYVLEFLRSEYGQIQMLRFVSGSTGQTELLIEHVRSLLIPMPEPAVQQGIVDQMDQAREEVAQLVEQADQFRADGANRLATARQTMMRRLAGYDVDSGVVD